MRAPTEKKTYRSRVFRGKDLAQSSVNKMSNVGGKATQSVQEMGWELVLGSRRRRSGGISSRSDRGDIRNANVRLAEPII